MNPADEMAAKIQPTERQLAGAAAASDDVLHKFDERWRALNDLQRTSDPVEDLHGSDDRLTKPFEDLQRPSPQQDPTMNDVLSGISHRLDDGTSERKAIYDRLVAIENEMKSRSSRGLARDLVAICIGVAATLAWQSYGETAKQIIATRVPELGWSPEAKQMMASWVQHLAWTKPPAGPENSTIQAAPISQTVPETPAAPSLDPEHVHQIALDVAALRQNVEQLTAGQEQMAREMTREAGVRPGGHTREDSRASDATPRAPIAPHLPLTNKQCSQFGLMSAMGLEQTLG